MTATFFFLLACVCAASGTELRHLSKGLKVFYELINTDLLEADYLEIMKYLDLRFHRTCFNTHEEESNRTSSVRELLTVVTAHDKEIRRLSEMMENNEKRFADEMDRIRDDCLRVGNDSKARDNEIQTRTVSDHKFYRKVCDIQAYETCQSEDCCIQPTFSYTNLALGKPAWQSSHYYVDAGKASAAVDGNRGDSSWNKETCFHTHLESRPWWMVDLGSMKNVGRVVMVNRADAAGDRLHDIVISVSSNKDEHGKICGYFSGPGQNGQVVEIKCAPKIQGRKLAYGLALLVAVLSTVKTSAGALKVTRVASFFEDKLVTQDITDDPERNTVLIIVGEVKDREDVKSSVNLHDFNTGYVALKDVADDTCLLKPIPFDKNEHIPGLRDYVNVKGTKLISMHKDMYWDVDRKVLSYDDVKQQAGDTLAEFCRDYRTYNLVPKSSKAIVKFLNGKGSPRRAKRCILNCGNCNN